MKSVEVSLRLMGHMPDKKWPHYLFRVSINGELFNYKVGIGHASRKRERGSRFDMETSKWVRTPTPEEVLYCLFLDADVGAMPFDEYCIDCLDQSTDLSLETYLACIDIKRRLRKCLGPKWDEVRKEVEDEEENS